MQVVHPEDRGLPNKGLELTAYSLRCAPASGSSSGLALDDKRSTIQTQPCREEDRVYTIPTAIR